MILCLLSTVVFGQTYGIDASHTAITTKVMRFGVMNVVGRFNNVSGRVTYNPDNLGAVSGEVVIQTESYSANNSEGEKAVKSPAFLDVSKYPEIKFTIKGLSKSGNLLTVSATLTIHGTSKDISFPVNVVGPLPDLPTGKKSIGISGIVKVNRLDFGVGVDRKMQNGTELIGSEVEIELKALALAE